MDWLQNGCNNINKECEIPIIKDFHTLIVYSHSTVPGGFEVISYTTLLTCSHSFVSLLDILASTSYGIFAQSAVIKSSVVIGLIAIR